MHAFWVERAASMEVGYRKC